MTRILFAIIALIGQIIRYLTPKLATASNPFSALTRYCIIGLPCFLILSKIFYGSRVASTDRKIGIRYILGGGIGTIAYILALKYGGTIPTITSITQLAIVITALISFIIFHEKLSSPQIVGIILISIGAILVLGFRK